MRNQNLQNQIDEIEFVRNNCAVMDADLKCQAYWGQHLCIMVAGFLENALYGVFRDYLDNTNRGRTKWNRIQNPRAQVFVAQSARLRQPWVSALENFISDDGRGVAIDTIMNQRNRIAHGRASNITMAQIAEYLPKCVAVVEFIEARLLSQALQPIP